VSEVIGVDEEIIRKTLERKHPEIEPFLRVVSSTSEEIDENPKAILQLRIDGLAPLITHLSYNIPTNEIIENLISQVVHITFLREENDKLQNDINELKEKVKTLQEEKADLRVQINNLEEELKKSWVHRLFKSGK
jgi:chromosome segregation ATPase